MEFTIILLVLCSVIFKYILLVTLSSGHDRRSRRVPPGPYCFPVIGNIFQLGKYPHQALARLSKTYGPLMYLKLGSIETIVVSSPEAAREVLQEHDEALSSRKVPDAATALNHDKMSFSWLPVGDKWRNFRKLSRANMFSVQKLDGSQGLRREKLRKLHDHVQECCSNGEVLDIGEAALTTSTNILSATLISVDFADFRSGATQEFGKLARGFMDIQGRPNLADYFPLLKFIDPQGIRRQASAYFEKLHAIFDDVIDQRLKLRQASSGDSMMNKDFLEALLDQTQKVDPVLNLEDLKHLLMDLFSAGVDSTAATVEWAMTQLMRNPEKMSKLKNELWSVVGKDEVKESDIARLPYLRSVIKETFRCHPSGPIMLPHKAKVDTEINGYLVPEGAQIIVNLWAIGRDSSIWQDPDTFSPERFLDRDIDVKGKDFELTPFGSGRRICPGLPLAYRTVHLMVATLVHYFDWKLEGDMKPEQVDITEIHGGLVLQKKVPLKAIPINSSRVSCGG